MGPSLRAIDFCALFLLGLSPRAFCQAPAAQAVSLTRAYGISYTQTERSDWARYDNGRYTGHVYREVRSTVSPEGNGAYRGTWVVLEETLRGSQSAVQPFDAVIPAVFTINPNGSINLMEDNGYPTLRGFPSFPKDAVRAGSAWTAAGVRLVDPRNEGARTAIPLMAEYEYRGQENYKGEAVHRIFARYATRYSSLSGTGLRSAQGRHEVDILISAETGLPRLIRDYLDETFAWADGSTLRFKGFTLIFADAILPMDRETIVQELENQHDELRIDVETVETGVRLTVRDLHFAADSDVFLDDERERLDLLARALAQVPGRMILVEGHTAAIGKPDGEMELSVRRAQSLIREMVARGISADRFVYKGWGGTRPTASNDTEEGRARNRRVELTILE